MKNLRAAREAKKITQEKLAEMLEVSRVTVARYESGDRWPDRDTLLRIADILDCSVDYLLGRVPMDVTVKKEAPPALAEGEKEIAFTIPDGDEAAFDAAFDEAVRQIVRQELTRRGI